jgi:tetratricopeptide (TPR) repeat protein
LAALSRGDKYGTPVHRMRPHSILFAVVVALCSQLAPAQTPQVTDPREMSDAARKAYTKGLKDARGLLADRKYAEAIVVLDQLSAERPREPQARFLKGVALADSGKTDDAISVYRALLADFPELPEVRNNLAVLYAQKGNYEGARDELVAALLAAPDYAIAYENLGDVYARLAGVNYEKAIARDAKNRTAPPKLKLVRDVLGIQSAPAPTTTPATPGRPEATPPAAMPAAAASDAPK